MFGLGLRFRLFGVPGSRVTSVVGGASSNYDSLPYFPKVKHLHQVLVFFLGPLSPYPQLALNPKLQILDGKFRPGDLSQLMLNQGQGGSLQTL